MISIVGLNYWQIQKTYNKSIVLTLLFYVLITMLIMVLRASLKISLVLKSRVYKFWFHQS